MRVIIEVIVFSLRVNSRVITCGSFYTFIFMFKLVVCCIYYYCYCHGSCDNHVISTQVLSLPETIRENRCRNQWRSQPENLVMLCKFFCVYRL